MIPISIITGYLGSGKTTLLAKALRHPAFARTAVIINEFGDVGLDHDLVETSDESLVTLQTGCICCRMRDDLSELLEDLLQRRRQLTVPAFDRVVIETSGLADPVPILQALMVDPATVASYRLADVITVVDAVNAATTLAHEREAGRQVSVADRLILTKSDLLTAPPDDLRETLRTLNPTAPVIDVQHGHVAPSVVFREPDRSELDRTTDLQELFENSDGLHSHAPHKAIATFAIVRDTPIPAVALTLFLEALADHCGSDLLRLKGLIAIAEHPSRPAVVHGVQHVFHPPHWLSHWPSDDTRTRLIFIGRHLSPKWIEALLNAIELEVADYQGGVSAESDLRAPDESSTEQTGAN